MTNVSLRGAVSETVFERAFLFPWLTLLPLQNTDENCSFENNCLGVLAGLV